MSDLKKGGTFSARLDTVSRYILLAVIFILPIATLPSGWLPLPLTKMGILALGVFIGLILWAAARLNEHKVEFPNSNLIWVTLLLVAGYLVAAVLSGNVMNSLVGFGFERDTALAMLTFVAAFAAVALTTRKVGHFIRLQQVALASFLVVGVFQIVRVTFGADVILPELFSTDPTATTLGSWSDLAVFGGLALLTSLSGLALFSPKKLATGGLYAVLLVSLFLLILVNLNAVWATLALATFLLAVYIFSDASYDRESGRFIPSVPWVKLLPSILVLIVSIIFLLGGTAIGERINDMFGVAFIDVRPSWEGTVAVGAGVFQENALFGVGPNAFREAWIDHKPMAVNETSFWNTDFTLGVGLIPSAFITGGLVVGLLWLLFFAAFIHLGFRMLAKRIAQPAHMYIAVSSYVGAAYLLALSVVHVPQTVMLAYTFMLIGAAVAAAHIAGVIRTREVLAERNYTSGLALTGAVLMVAVVSFGGFLVHAERVTAGVMLSRAIVVANDGELDRAEYIAERASLFANDIRSSQLKTNTGLIRLTDTLSVEMEDVEAQRAKVQEEITNTVSAAQATVSTDPDNYRNWLLLADVYARLASLNVDGAYESAVAALEEAKSRNAKNPIIQVNLSRLALEQGDLGSARAYAEEALTLKGNYTDAHYLLSQISIREGNADEAIRSTESAILLRPGNAGLLFQLGILHYSRGSYDKVVPVLERAVAINPSYANALYFLGLSYDKLGNTEGALAAFERVAALNPDNTEVQSVVTALTEGKSAFEALGDNAPVVSELQPLPVSDGQ